MKKSRDRLANDDTKTREKALKLAFLVCRKVYDSHKIVSFFKQYIRPWILGIFKHKTIEIQGFIEVTKIEVSTFAFIETSLIVLVKICSSKSLRKNIMRIQKYFTNLSCMIVFMSL